MTPKQKAKEIVNKFYYYVESISESQQEENAKQCALIAVDEILNCDCYFKTLEDSKEFTKYWYEVQQEINKL
jgi:hypothetical protein